MAPFSLPSHLTGGSAFVVDRNGRFLGAVAAADAAITARQGPRRARAFASRGSGEGESDRGRARAERCEQLAVTDEDGRLVGCISGAQVLARIGQVPATVSAAR